ncbi:TPA: ParA family protein [Vibrio harveyi]
MTKKIAITNKKGGAGKTTSSINLSTELSSRGKRVLVIDLDPQANCTKVLADGFEYNLTTADVFKNYRNTNITDVIIATNIENLHIIPSEPHLEAVIESSMAVRNREDILRKVLAPIKDSYDYIIMDCPPNLGLTTMNALKLSDFFLIPIDAGDFSIDGLAFILDAIEDVKDLEQGTFSDFSVYYSMYEPNNAIMNSYTEKELSVISDNVLSSRIRKATAFSQANVVKKPLKLFDPKHKAVGDVEDFTTEVMKRVEAL